MTTSYLLPAENNFADLHEQAAKLLRSTEDNGVKRLAGIVGTLLYRCDMLEREVERLGRGASPIATPPPTKTPRAKSSGKR